MTLASEYKRAKGCSSLALAARKDLLHNMSERRNYGIYERWAFLVSFFGQTKNEKLKFMRAKKY